MDEIALVNLIKEYRDFYKKYKRNRIWAKKIKRKAVVQFVEGLADTNGLLARALECSGNNKYQKAIDYVDKDFKRYKSVYRQLDTIVDILDSVV